MASPLSSSSRYMVPLFDKMFSSLKSSRNYKWIIHWCCISHQAGWLLSRKQTTNAGENVKKGSYTLLAVVWKLVWKILQKLKIDGALAFQRIPVPQSTEILTRTYLLLRCVKIIRQGLFFDSSAFSLSIYFLTCEIFYSFCSIKNTSKHRFISIHVYVHLCIHVWVPMEARRSQISWSWFIKWLQAAKHRHREPNLYTWEEQQAFLTSEPYF